MILALLISCPHPDLESETSYGTQRFHPSAVAAVFRVTITSFPEAAAATRIDYIYGDIMASSLDIQYDFYFPTV